MWRPGKSRAENKAFRLNTPGSNELNRHRPGKRLGNDNRLYTCGKLICRAIHSPGKRKHFIRRITYDRVFSISGKKRQDRIERQPCPIETGQKNQMLIFHIFCTLCRSYRRKRQIKPRFRPEYILRQLMPASRVPA